MGTSVQSLSSWTPRARHICVYWERGGRDGARANLWSYFCVDTQTEWAFWNATQSSCYCGAASIIVPASLPPSRCLLCPSLTAVASFPLFPLFFPFSQLPHLAFTSSFSLSLSVLPLCRFELLIIYLVVPLPSSSSSPAPPPAHPSAIHFFNLFLSRTLALRPHPLPTLLCLFPSYFPLPFRTLNVPLCE